MTTYSMHLTHPSLRKGSPFLRRTDLPTDGIGYWLFQKHCQCPSNEIFCCQAGWKVTLVGSRFTHPAVEGEALAVADALDKARLGCSNLIIAVDHKPLLKLFGDRSLEDIPNTRLRNSRRRPCVIALGWCTYQGSGTTPAMPFPVTHPETENLNASTSRMTVPPLPTSQPTDPHNAPG